MSISNYQYFELHRLSDDLVYQFDRVKNADGSYVYKRRDLDLFIIHKPDFGWVAVDPLSGEITGRPWNVLPRDQDDHPPEGDWVSRKGVKSYVYQLIYSTPPLGSTCKG